MGGGGGGTDTKTVCQTVSEEEKYKKFYQHNVEPVRGTINISKYVKNF